MYYLRARYYDPEIARFISEDSYKGNVNDPLSLNLYTYCRNNPITRIDPSGHKDTDSGTSVTGYGGGGGAPTGGGYVDEKEDIYATKYRPGYGTSTSGGTNKKPMQIHHFLTNKSLKYTSQFENITKKYGLDLNGDWNKFKMPHQGRHTNAYHDYMLNELKRIDMIAKGDKFKFFNLFESVKNDIIKNPDIVTRKFWYE